MDVEGDPRTPEAFDGTHVFAQAPKQVPPDELKQDSGTNSNAHDPFNELSDTKDDALMAQMYDKKNMNPPAEIPEDDAAEMLLEGDKDVNAQAVAESLMMAGVVE